MIKICIFFIYRFSTRHSKTEMDNAPEIFEKSSPWMRLSLCVNIHVKKALLQVVHNDIREPQVTAIP